MGLACEPQACDLRLLMEKGRGHQEVRGLLRDQCREVAHVGSQFRSDPTAVTLPWHPIWAAI
jgi:hypothetical protein